jgi:hypothetical protein
LLAFHASGCAIGFVLTSQKSGRNGVVSAGYAFHVWLVSRVFFTYFDAKSTQILYSKRNLPYQLLHSVYIAQRFGRRLQTERNFFPDGKANPRRSA